MYPTCLLLQLFLLGQVAISCYISTLVAVSDTACIGSIRIKNAREGGNSFISIPRVSMGTAADGSRETLRVRQGWDEEGTHS